ncbi:hypothetical protein, partial [Bilophila sp.]|uniref:hypothetical protein n=1 Tax=Bilophila sp. TaxID=1929485 RepID=UPI00307748E2
MSLTEKLRHLKRSSGGTSVVDRYGRCTIGEEKHLIHAATSTVRAFPHSTQRTRDWGDNGSS